MDDISVNFEDKALKLIAKTAKKEKVGARALRSILENIMLDHMFNAPTSKSKTVKVTYQDVKKYIKSSLSKELQEILFTK